MTAAAPTATARSAPPFKLGRRASPLAGPQQGADPEGAGRGSGQWRRCPPRVLIFKRGAAFPAEKDARGVTLRPKAAGGRD